MKPKYIFVGPDPKNISNNHPGGQLTAARGLTQYAQENDIKLTIIDTLQSSFPIPSFRIRIYKFFRRLILFIKYLQKTNITGVIIFSSSGFSFIEKSIMIIISRLHKIPSILFLRSGHFFNSLNGKLSFIYKFFIKFPTIIGVQGSQWKKSLEIASVPSRKILVIPNWVSDDKNLVINQLTKKHLKMSTKPVFVYLGWLVEQKGIFDLVNAYRDSNILKSCKLVIIGDGHQYEKINNDIKKYHLSNIELKGWCTTTEVKTILKNSDILVLPSYAEGFPNAIIEAFTFGLPVISTNVGGIPDSVKNGWNGFIVKPGDRNQLKDAMEKLVLNKNLIIKFSKNSIKILNKRHSQKENCKKIFNALEYGNLK